MKAKFPMPADKLSLAVAGPTPSVAVAAKDAPMPVPAVVANAGAAETQAPPLTRRQIAAEVGMRLIAVFLFSFFVSGALHQFIKDPSRLTVILLVISETLVLALAVCTRVPRERDWSPLTVVVASFASFYFLLFSMTPGIRLIPESVAVGLQIVGMVVQISAKLTLRRSYGILPANRGVVIGGPYRFIRHPIYFGYFIYNAGFLLPSFGLRYLVVLVLLWTMQIIRVIREERVLIKDPTYRAYTERVRYRLIPGVF
jgi:protein-S-isoprenylcysteine O-methyltransferase Ste14